MIIDYEKMHRHIIKKLNSINKPQAYLLKRVGIGRSTLWRLSKGKVVKMDNLIKLIDWLEKDLNNYFFYEGNPNEDMMRRAKNRLNRG